MTDRRERPWRKLRVIVEVTVPPTSKAKERDLAYQVSEALPTKMFLPRRGRLDAQEAVVRIKGFASFWPMFLRKEKGLSNFKKKKKESNTHDPNNGL